MGGNQVLDLMGSLKAPIGSYKGLINMTRNQIIEMIRRIHEKDASSILTYSDLMNLIESMNEKKGVCIFYESRAGHELPYRLIMGRPHFYPLLPFLPRVPFLKVDRITESILNGPVVPMKGSTYIDFNIDQDVIYRNYEITDTITALCIKDSPDPDKCNYIIFGTLLDNE